MTNSPTNLENAERAEMGVKVKKPCQHVHDHVVCVGRGSTFNVYRCRYCGDEEWL